MEMSSRLGLRVLDQQPPRATATGTLAYQIWKGGATDLSTRTMIPEPARWLMLAEHDRDQPLADAAGSLLAWNLEPVLVGALSWPVNAGGVILVSMDVDTDREEEFNAWYNTEHIPHLSTVPGVLAARRFRAARAAPTNVAPAFAAPCYVALYHVENTDIYASQAWTAANVTAWMQRMRRFQRNRTYFMFRSRVA